MEHSDCTDPIPELMRGLASLGVTGQGKADPITITIDVPRVRRALPTLPREARAVLDAFAKSVCAALDSRPAETGHTAAEQECPMDPSTFFTHTQHNADMPYPFNNVPPPDEPLTDVRLMDTLGPLLAQLAGLTQVLAVTKLDEVSPAQLHAVHGLLAAHTRAAQTILRRWWDDRQED